MFLQKRFRRHTKLLFFKQRNSCNSLLLCILCKLFLLLSQVSIEPKRSWTLQNSVLRLCFSKIVPGMGGKHFRQTAGSCKGVIVWLKYILHIQADLASSLHIPILSLPFIDQYWIFTLHTLNLLFFHLLHCIHFNVFISCTSKMHLTNIFLCTVIVV